MRPQHPRASREQRSPHTRGPTAPDARARRPHLRAPRRHLPLPDARARGDGAQAASADPEAAPRRGRGPAPPRGDSRGAEQGRLRARGRPPLHGCPGAPAWRPHPAAGGGDPGAADRGRLALPGLEGSGVGQAGGAVGGCGRAALTRVCAAPWSRASRRGDRLSLQLPFRQDGSSALRLPCASPSHLPPRTPAHSLGMGRGGASVSLRTPA